VLSGSVDVSSLTPDQLTALKTGNTYANVHTAANPAGELRGQVAPVNYVASLTGPGEVPPVNSSGTGSATLALVGIDLFWDLTYTGLSANATAAHVHGPAPTTQAAGVLFGIGTPTGTSGTLVGSQTLTLQELDYILDGLTYVNVHTSANPGGEIRGQIVPQ
jgi:hypothetical protein